MFQPLENAAEAFGMARDDYFEGVKAQNAEATLDALYRALQAADAILSFLGYIDEYECGECAGCKARGAARRESMQAAVDADPDLSPTGPLGPFLTPAEESDARRLLADIFGPNATPEDFTESTEDGAQ